MEDKLEQLEKRIAIIERFVVDKITTKQEPSEPECPYKEGELIAVRPNGGAWVLRYSTGRLNSGWAECYEEQLKSGFTQNWKNHASTNGLKLPE